MHLVPSAVKYFIPKHMIHLKQQDVFPVMNCYHAEKTLIQLFTINFKILIASKTKDLGTYFCVFATINSFCLPLEHVATQYI